MERGSLSVSIPLLWPKNSSEGIHKTNEDPNFGHAKIFVKERKDHIFIRFRMFPFHGHIVSS